MSQSTLTPIHLCSSARRLEGTSYCEMCCETVVHGEDDGVATRLFGGIYDGWNPPYSPSVNLICGNYKSLGNPHKNNLYTGMGLV